MNISGIYRMVEGIFKVAIKIRDEVKAVLTAASANRIISLLGWKRPVNVTADGRPFGSPYEGQKGMPNKIHPPEITEFINYAGLSVGAPSKVDIAECELMLKSYKEKHNLNGGG